jgi:hypothetical protein
VDGLPEAVGGGVIIQAHTLHPQAANCVFSSQTSSLDIVLCSDFTRRARIGVSRCLPGAVLGERRKDYAPVPAVDNLKKEQKIEPQQNE